MPATSNMRGSKTTTVTAVTQGNEPNSATRRTTSGRAVRANTTRPTNYYARPFGSFSAAANLQDELQEDSTPGFYPAIQYFTDAITALPKEVMRQFTLIKEAEAKIYGPNEKIGELADTLMTYSVPPRKGTEGTANAAQGIVSLTANNSTSGSTSASLINGIAPNAPNHSAQNSISGSMNGDEGALQESSEEMTKRKHFYDLRLLLANSLANLDEKNGLLAEANRVLKQQMSRIDSVMPHVDNEISEEARLGSMTHWAYSDNRQKKQPVDHVANRRNVAATNSLAAAASAIHENDILQARRDAVREPTRGGAKGRGRDVDSDFDDKPRKNQGKKGKTAGNNSAGLGIVNGEPVKKRKLDKGLAAPAMERSSSAATKAAKAMKEAQSGSTPVVESGKKATKAKPGPPKRKNLNSAQPSPALASSPLQSTFTPASIEPRPQSARARQGSAASHLRHEKLIEEHISQPVSKGNRVNGEKAASKRKALDESRVPGPIAEEVAKSTEPADETKNEDADMADIDQAPPSRSASNSGKAGRGSKTGTPRHDNFPVEAPSMQRTRSMRSMRGNGGDESSVEPSAQNQNSSKHKRQRSDHLVKQLAPFNRSPDLDRHLQEGDEDRENVDIVDRERRNGQSPHGRTGSSRPTSRRNTTTSSVPVAQPSFSAPVAPPPGLEDDEEDLHRPNEPDAALGGIEAEPEPELSPPPVTRRSTRDLEPPPLEADVGDIDIEDDEPEVGDEEEEEGSETGDPDDPNETKYCYCNRGSYGDMVACDNEACPREWFHLGCTELMEAPSESETWYCSECRPLFVRPRKVGRGGGRGGGR